MIGQYHKGPEHQSVSEQKAETSDKDVKLGEGQDVASEQANMELMDVKESDDIPKPEKISDDSGKDICEADKRLKPDASFILNGVEYKTDDTGKIYCVDGNYIENSSFVINGREYRTNDSGEIIKNGGSYKEVKKNSNGEISEVHHIPADSTTNLDRNDGPAIKMDKADHRQTASCGNSKEAREYQEMQRELIDQGKFREAIQMDIDDIHDKFGNKYDEAISEMLEYVDQLEKGDRI